MKLSFEETLIEVWRQALVDNAKAVVLGTERYPIVWTSKRRLREIDFVFDGKEINNAHELTGNQRRQLHNFMPSVSLLFPATYLPRKP